MKKNKQTIVESVAGMGAILTKEGVAFRVWAPNAKKVSVAGNFNDWSNSKDALESEGNGFWYGFVEKAKAGSEYKYCITTQENKKLMKNDPYAKAMTNSAGNSLVHDSHYDWKGDNFTLPSWNELVIYEMHVGTYNGTKKGHGTFASVIKKMDHLTNLGINAIEIMPVNEFPGDISWGYNPSYPFAVETAYGGSKGLKDLVKAAHKKGIAIILDVVYNHFGPSDNDMWRFDGWSENDMGGIYFYNDKRSATPWGNTRPDYGRQEVRQYIRDNALMWLNEYHIDGLRLDGTMFMRNIEGVNMSPANDIEEVWEFFQWLNSEIHEKCPNKIVIAEDLMNNAWITKDASEKGAGFGSQWWADFVHPVRSVIIPKDDEFRDMDKLVNAVNFPPESAFQRVIYTESHDEVANGRARVPEEIWPDHADSYYSKKRSFLGAGVTFTSPGIPMMFQGQELLEDKWFVDTEPLDWKLAKKNNGIFRMYAELIKLRRNFDGNTKGLKGNHVQVYHVDHELKMIAYQRWMDGGPGDTVIVVLNFADHHHQGYTIGLPDKGDWKLRFNSDWKGYDEEFSDQATFAMQAKKGKTDGMPYYGLMDVGPYSVLLFSQDKG